MAKKIAVGVADFGKIMENNCFYVDKTNFIKEWWENGDEVTLITRPRRFGKTLLMSMVEQFFSIKYADRGNLFHGLSIWEESRYRALHGTYPVIFFSFADIKGSSFQETYADIKKLMAYLYRGYSFLLEGGCLIDSEKKEFSSIMDDRMDASSLKFALKQLSGYLSRYYQKKVMILLDEYDTPMQEAYVNGYWEDLSGFMRGMLGSTFKNNPYLERGIMTGIMRISKESLFSGLNHLKVVTVTSQKYEEAFGFTEDEVAHALEVYGLKGMEGDVKSWYDGYRFGDCGHIYNPWSIVNFLAEKKLAAYWSHTSSNKLAGDLIQKGAAGIKQSVEDLLNGKTICAAIDEEIVFEELGYQKNAVWGLLLASGYLRIDGFQLNRRGKQEHLLALTNLEVREAFDHTFAGWLDSKGYPNDDFSDALLAGDQAVM